MKLNLEPKDIQAILDALQNETFHQSVATRAKIIEQLKKSPKYATVM